MTRRPGLEEHVSRLCARGYASGVEARSARAESPTPGDLVETLHQREVELKVVTGQGAQVDTTTANGRLVLVAALWSEQTVAWADASRTRSGSGSGAAGRPAAQNG